ncbi:hypothetical protein JQS43_21910 [Natronosporangium hydrolyticum]|uniref:Uncharacterized protein n=1 Tax=Natronosporangium hydrolyticum TaxID=2811111 RepID=A0A895YDA2_9ACTN|nr:hypothetical protein [Natronosporangium hydrolyticum]QSB14152.1 hypothetical protein JQS43_21910 [Natronosporangium hydrolyticum]
MDLAAVALPYADGPRPGGPAYFRVEDGLVHHRLCSRARAVAEIESGLGGLPGRYV